MAKIIGGVALIAGAVLVNVIPGIGQAVSSALITTIGGVTPWGVTAAATTMLGTMGAGMTLSSIGQALMGGGQPLSQSLRQPMAPRVTIYGETRVGGVILYMSNPGFAINQVVAWASHKCAQVKFLYLDGREVYFAGTGHTAVAGAEGWCDDHAYYDASGNKYNFTASSGNHHIYAKSVLGDPAGEWINYSGAGLAAPPPPGGDNNFEGDPKWDPSCTLNGICATYLGAASNPDMFSGIPNPKASVQGKCDIYDPRLGAQFTASLLGSATQTPTTVGGSSTSGITSTAGNLLISSSGSLTNADVSITWAGYGSGTAPSGTLVQYNFALSGGTPGLMQMWVSDGMGHNTGGNIGSGGSLGSTGTIDVSGFDLATLQIYVHMTTGAGSWSPPITLAASVGILGAYTIPNPATHIWTDNWALIIADFLVNKDFGVGCDWDEIDIAQLIVAANICDEQVALAGVTEPWEARLNVYLGTQLLDSNGNIETVTGVPSNGVGECGLTPPTWPTTVGGTVSDGNVTWTMSHVPTTPTYESRYTINGSFDWSAAPGDTLNSLLAAAEGRISYQGGLWNIFPAAWYGSTLSFDMGDLTGPVKWNPVRKFRDLFNAVRATFVCPSYPYAVSGYDRNHKNNNIFDGQFQPTDAPEYAQDALHGYSSDANLAADGGLKLYTDSRYQFVNSVGATQRLMKIRLLRNRFQGTGSLQMSLGAYRTCPQDIIRLTAPVFGWSDKYLEVTSFNFVPAKSQASQEGGGDQNDEAITLGCQLEVCETDPSIYSWSAAEERGLENILPPTLLDSLQVADPTALTLASDASTGILGIGGVTPRIQVDWTAPADPFTVGGGQINVQYQLAGASTWATAPSVAGNLTECFIAGVAPGASYNVRIQAQHASGTVGNWVQGGPVAVGTGAAASGSNTATIAETVSDTSVALTWGAQTVDGISVPSGSATLSSLSPSTAYYTYWYILTSDGSINRAAPTWGPNPSIAPSASLLAQTSALGRVSLGCLAFTTLSSGATPVTGTLYPVAS